MSTSEATIKALKELGLTEYETPAYLALVEGGQISASDVIPDQRYRIHEFMMFSVG